MKMLRRLSARSRTSEIVTDRNSIFYQPEPGSKDAEIVGRTYVVSVVYRSAFRELLKSGEATFTEHKGLVLSTFHVNAQRYAIERLDRWIDEH